MNVSIKQLSKNNLIFFPLTVAEAVLVKDNLTVITLDELLDRKIEQITTPAGAGLIAHKLDKNYIITHTNSITANESPSPVKVKYDNRGHIVETSPINNMNLIVDLEGYVLYNGSEDKNINMGNDFGIDEDNRIILKWNHL